MSSAKVLKTKFLSSTTKLLLNFAKLLCLRQSEIQNTKLKHIKSVARDRTRASW